MIGRFDLGNCVVALAKRLQRLGADLPDFIVQRANDAQGQIGIEVVHHSCEIILAKMNLRQQ